MLKRIHCKLIKLFLGIEAENWCHIKYQNREFKKRIRVQIQEYSQTAPKKECTKRVIHFCDGKTQMGGLADRLRGIVSIYEVCKKNNLEFKIIFNSPFDLKQYIIPNKVDWEISLEELNYNTNITDICYIPTMRGTSYEGNKQALWFNKEFRKSYKEFHVRTNAFFAYKRDFSTLFNELFRPSHLLQASIDKHRNEIGDNFISVSARFLNLLDDFNETVKIDKKLSKDEKIDLITRNLSQIQNLHQQYPEKKILVNSDSTTFLLEARKFEYVYTIPGNITHIDAGNDSHQYFIYEKTFLDLFMIANAERIFLLRTGEMYNSGYPFLASKIYCKPFEVIEF